MKLRLLGLSICFEITCSVNYRTLQVISKHIDRLSKFSFRYITLCNVSASVYRQCLTCFTSFVCEQRQHILSWEHDRQHLRAVTMQPAPSGHSGTPLDPRHHRRGRLSRRSSDFSSSSNRLVSQAASSCHSTRRTTRSSRTCFGCWTVTAAASSTTLRECSMRLTTDGALLNGLCDERSRMRLCSG